MGSLFDPKMSPPPPSRGEPDTVIIRGEEYVREFFPDGTLYYYRKDDK